MGSIGFDNQKYLTTQSEQIKKRIHQFGGKLYLEFGGKLFDDYHASRVLPGFAPDSKIRMLQQLKDDVEIVIAINAGDIEKNKMRGDLGITYDEDVLRLIDIFRDMGLYVGSVVLTRYSGQDAANAFLHRLEKLGIAWKQRMEQAWERGYAAAREYRGEYGNLMVPVRYRDKNGFALGEWIVYNRQRFLGNNLSTDRAERLEALGMVWDTVQDIWEQSYCAAVQYWLDHGTLEVPVKYTTPEGVALGVWLGSQRAAYKAGTIKPVQKAWLEALDVDWTNRNDRKWQAAYDAAARYYQAHGDLNVPSEYIDPDGVLLGKWVSRQRYAWQNPDRSSARLTPERKVLLDQLGMVWQKPDSWQHRYELAAAYKAAQGSLELPAQYRTEEGIWLGSWLSRQKQLLQKGDKSLSGERVKALKELFRGELERRSGAVRTRARCSVRERNWLNNYRHAKAYAKRRGDLLVPASYVDETGFRLGVWISNLRAARKTRPDSFQVTPEHIAMLDEIGMQWDAREAKWQCALRRAGEYRAAHGDLAVPVNYKTEDGFCLGDWIRRMRESYAAHDARLTPERVENLSALGMVWTPAEG